VKEGRIRNFYDWRAYAATCLAAVGCIMAAGAGCGWNADVSAVSASAPGARPARVPADSPRSRAAGLCGMSSGEIEGILRSRTSTEDATDRSSGPEAITIGPLTLTFASTAWWDAPSRMAHERQHRADWLSGLPGWKKEQRAFAAEVPVIEDQLFRYQSLLAELEALRYFDEQVIDNVQEAVGGLTSSLAVARGISFDDGSAMA